jgi:hypothetical protein
LRASRRSGAADAIYYLCTLHGRYPGVIDHAAARITDPAARAWIAQATYAFAGSAPTLPASRSAAGPVPSTPGAAASDAAVHGQRHAWKCSPVGAQRLRARRGDGGGARLGRARVALDAAARRFGVSRRLIPLADTAAISAVADQFGAQPFRPARLLFGAEQILLQHRGLWDLLESATRPAPPTSARRAGSG